MNIGMVSRWNVPCGVSMRAELIGRAWVKMGHEVKIFAPKEPKDLYIALDEPYVVRCWGGDFLDERPFFEEEFDIFLVQTPVMPYQNLMRVYPRIKERAKTIFVVHDQILDRDISSFYPDCVVCFDERYKSVLIEVIPEEKIHIIPYPCHPVKKGNKKEARQKLRLPLDKKIVFNFGIGIFKHIHLLPPLKRLCEKHPFLLLTITWVKDWFELFEALKSRYPFIELRFESLPLALLYTYLHASDALLIHKDSAEGIAVSSTVYQCLGSGCPIVVHKVNFFETLNDEVLKYKNLEELKEKLEGLFEGKEEVNHTIKKALVHAEKNKGEEIGRKFLNFFETLR